VKYHLYLLYYKVKCRIAIVWTWNGYIFATFFQSCILSLSGKLYGIPILPLFSLLCCVKFYNCLRRRWVAGGNWPRLTSLGKPNWCLTIDAACPGWISGGQKMAFQFSWRTSPAYVYRYCIAWNTTPHACWPKIKGALEWSIIRGVVG